MEIKCTPSEGRNFLNRINKKTPVFLLRQAHQNKTKNQLYLTDEISSSLKSFFQSHRNIQIFTIAVYFQYH
jgi:hypothetical protein